MARYRTIPSFVEAVQFTGTEYSVTEILKLQSTSKDTVSIIARGKTLLINASTRFVRAEIGYWVVLNKRKEILVYADEEFKNKFEKF